MTNSSQINAQRVPLSGRTLVIGGNRGLGLEIVRELVRRELPVTVVCRKSSSELDSIRGVEKVLSEIDLTNADQVASVYKEHLAGQKFENLVVIAGLFSPEEFGSLDYEKNMKMYQVCCLGPLQLIEGLVSSSILGQGSRIGMITSEGGSTTLRSEEEGGNNYGHHMSKCAQNMMGRLLAWDIKPKGISMVMIHPGFMITEMTSHYKDMQEKFGAQPPEKVVGGILECIERTSLENSGNFITAVGSKNFGMGIMALENPEETLKQFAEVPF